MTDSVDGVNVLVSELANDAGMVELVEMFVNELPDKVAAIKKAMEDQDFEALRALAHQLKGSGGGYGFPAITKAAAEIEATTKADRDLRKLTAEVAELTSLCDRAKATSSMG